MTADDYIQVDDQVLCDVTTDDIVEAVIEKRDTTNDEVSSDEGLERRQVLSLPTKW